MSAELQNEASFESGILGFFYRQWFLHRKPIPAGTSLAGQAAIVTGSNVGLGLEASRQLLELGLSTLIMGVRSMNKGIEASNNLRNAFPNVDIEVWSIDMESYDSVKDFATRCEGLERIDIVILNAGLNTSSFERLESTGHDKCLQVNYLSTALLSILLLPTLKSRQLSSRPPVVSIVTSDMAYWTSLNAQGPVLAQLDCEEGFSQLRQYAGTKLMEMFFVSKLATLVSSDDVIINLTNPGFTAGTMLQRTDPSFWGPIFQLFKAIMTRSIEVGASTYVDATVIQGKASHGSYCSDWAIRPYPPLLYTENGQKIKERLWEETMEELNFAGVSKIVQSMANPAV